MEKHKKRKEFLRRYAWFSVFLASCYAASCHLPHQNPFLGGLRLQGFEQASPLVVYNKENIFDYINGEAEVYLQFGFRLLYTQHYEKRETGALIIVDAYDMGTNLGAQGVFGRYSGEGGSEVQRLGESAWTDKYIVLFRHGRYFFRVTPDFSSQMEVKASLQDMLELSRAIDGAI